MPLASGERLERVYAVRGGAATVGLRSVGPANVAWGAGDARAPWDLRLSGDLPLQLRVSTGAGRAQIDLSRLQVSGLELSAGVGQVDVTLPERGRLTASISAGVGETVVRVPAGVAAGAST